MTKEQDENSIKTNSEEIKNNKTIPEVDIKSENNDEKKLSNESLEEKILELEDRLARTLAEMENQRRRFEKEKEEAFEYGGFSFAKEALSLIDNLERSKQILENDESLKN